MGRSSFHPVLLSMVVVFATALPAHAIFNCSYFKLNTKLDPKFLVRHDGGINMQVTDPNTPGWRPLDLPYKLFRRLLGVDGVSRIHRDIVRDKSSDNVFIKAERAMDLDLRVDPEWLAKVPKTGPLVITANHSLSGVDGIALAATISRVRPDVKIMLNKTFSDMKVLDGAAIFANPIDERDPANVSALRQSIAHLKKGGVLIVFPSGEVSGQKRDEAVARDPEWIEGAAKLAMRSGAHVMPAFVAGQPSDLFLAARRRQPFLATALILREMARLKGATIPMYFGEPIAPAEVAKFKSAGELNDHLRAMTYALAGSVEKARGRGGRAAAARVAAQETIAPPTPPAELKAAVEALPKEALLLESGNLQVFIAEGGKIPTIMREIGQRREETFRAAGEGSGKALDIDEYDPYYQQLFVWDKAAGKIAGAYRLGLGDKILAEKGPTGFYNAKFFDLSRVMKEYGPKTMELGRSFVHPEYQGSRTLSLTWKGIGEFVVRNPQYTSLVGPVSMSADYQTTSKQILLAYLARHHGGDPTLVRSLNAPNFSSSSPMSQKELDSLIASSEGGLDRVSRLIQQIEPDGKGAPMLFENYLNWNGEFLAFYDDRAFNTVDGFIHVDLLRANPRTMQFGFGRENAAKFRALHGLPPLEKKARGDRGAPAPDEPATTAP